MTTKGHLAQDPRVVRSFGGKDRHSKVCTIRGLKDRRVRLSGPTAIKLYDLQHRLGLNQPSKVVDWLINLANDDINQLPPLPISPTHFTQFPQSANLDLAKEDRSGFKIKEGFPGEYDQNPNSTFFNLYDPTRFEEISRDDPSYSGLLPYNSFYHWNPSSLFLSEGNCHGSSIQQAEDSSAQNYNVIPPSSQSLLCPSATTPFFFPPYITGTAQVDSNSRQINHLQMLSSRPQNPVATSPYTLCSRPSN